MGIIGVITNSETGVFQSLVIRGVRWVAEPAAYEVRVDALQTATNTYRPVSLDLEQVDGILAIANAAPPEFLQRAYELGKPVSLVSHHLPDVPIPEVVFNNAQGIQALLAHLVKDCGRQQIVFIRGVQGQYDAQLREQTFRRELMRYNLHMPDTHYLAGDFEADIAAESIRNFVKSGMAFDAVLASDYVMAAAVITELRALGIAVPQQVAVVGFGDAPEAKAAGVTTVSANVEALGECGARQLIHQIDGLKIRGVTMLSVDLLIRESSVYRE
jgi:LacI family transcriptional regulator